MWPDVDRLASRRNYKMPSFPKASLIALMPSLSESGVELMEWMFKFNPAKRPVAE